MAERSSGAFEDGALNVVRIVAGLLFMQHGAQKVFGWLGGVAGSGASADLMSQMGLAGVIEFFGGLLIAVGLFTVPVALIAAAEMVAAYLIAHIGNGLWPIQNGGELALLYAVTWIYLAARGPGNFSLDAKLRGVGADAAPALEPPATGPRPTEQRGTPAS